MNNKRNAADNSGGPSTWKKNCKLYNNEFQCVGSMDIKACTMNRYCNSFMDVTVMTDRTIS